MAKKPYSVTNKTGKKLYLYSITTPRFYFSAKLKKTALTEKPVGYKVVRIKSGLPFLKKI